MDNIIVYLDEPDFSLHQLAPMKNLTAGPAMQATHWILVACPPHLTHHASRWISDQAMQSWRAKWADELFASLVPTLHSRGDKITTVLAHGDLVELTQQLQVQHGLAHVLDARRPRFGQDLPHVTADQSEQHSSYWEIPAAVTGMGAALMLVAE
ncbi:MAG: hypothetical protein WBI20_06945 [Burkholderiaceae bacterium]